MHINLENQEEIIEHYGADNQLTIHMEECAELIQAISKCLRSESISNFDYQHLIEEIADVMVCIEQLKYIFNIPDESIEKIANLKIERQKGRIKDEI